MFPGCDVCGKELQNWSGNIMIPTKDFIGQRPQRIEAVKVMCKACTVQLDKSGIGQAWHNLWELAWMKDHTLRYLGQIIANLISKEPRIIWSDKAIERIYQLAI